MFKSRVPVDVSAHVSRIMAFAVMFCLLFSALSHAAEEVNIYTHRHYDVDQELFKQFTAKTGIEVNVVKAKADQLIARLKSEGEASPADLLFTVDVGRLHKAKSEGLLQPVSSAVLQSAIPAHLRDEQGYWFGLTKRARVLVYHKDRVSADALSTYEALADEEWKDRIVIRSSANMYNQSLMASFIAANGKPDALRWAKAVVGNMARPPKGNDRDQVKAVAAGQADVAVVNTYYIGLLLNSDNKEEVEAGKQVKVFFPNQTGRGTHINISGVGVTKSAKNVENAIALIEFMASPKSQEQFAKANYEYPVVAGIPLSELVASWGSFKEDDIPLSRIGELNTEAVILFDRARWK